jgi:hypothetical protein
MPGPLATMFSGLNQQNDADYAANNAGVGRALFNARLSHLADNFGGGRMPDDDGGPIVLGEEMPRDRRLSPEWFGDYGAFYKTPMDRSAEPPKSFRDPMQGGPEPPVDPRILARLFGDKRE